jgi:hypothetical protein
LACPYFTIATLGIQANGLTLKDGANEMTTLLLASEVRMKFVLICMLVMFALIGLGQVAVSNGAPHLAIALWSLALSTIGVSLYRLRLRSRSWYGALELVVSLVASYFVLLNLYQHATGLTAQIILSRMLILFGTVYVMVRALDNIGQGLLPSWRFAKVWDRLFRN